MNTGMPEIESTSSASADVRQEYRLTLHKGEKLRHRSLVEPLFSEGITFYDYPLRLTWRVLSDRELQHTFRDLVPERIDRLQMLITVPKKKRRRAVDRVLMRRRIREAYRLNRVVLKDQVEQYPDIRTLGMAFIYLHDKNLPYSTIEMKMRGLLKRLSRKLHEMAEP